MVLHLLMNASTDKTSHLAIAKALLRALLAVAHSTDPSRAQHAEFALGTLANISKNSHVRQILYVGLLSLPPYYYYYYTY